jgi:hypothetical protein
MINEVSFEVLDIYLKIFLLLFADDAVLMSENVDGMQTMLNIFSEYYNTWQLQVNIAKTNVVIYSKSKATKGKGKCFRLSNTYITGKLIRFLTIFGNTGLFILIQTFDNIKTFSRYIIF